MEAPAGDKAKKTITMSLPLHVVEGMHAEADRQRRAKVTIWELAAREYLRRRSRKAARPRDPLLSPSASQDAQSSTFT